MVRIRVLGASEITIGHRRIGMSTELLFALALYLTTRAGERIAREDLLDLFWPQGTGDDRRHALRQMLYRLRQKGLGLEEEGDWIGVDATVVDSDLRDTLADGWPENAEAAAVDAAAALTPTFSKRLSREFLEWLDGVREQLAAQHRRASLRQIYLARREARWADLERWAVPILRTDPLNEEATLARAESAAMAGSKTLALEILDNYLTEVGEISEELGRPALLLRKRLAERRPDWATRGPKEVPLVGRRELMSRLTGLVEAAWRGEGSAVVLVGAPGIGKTRLAMEARAYAELKGMRTVVVRAEVGNSERPFALLQAVVAAFLDLPGAAGCDPESLAVLKRITDPRFATDSDVGSTDRSLLRHIPAALREVSAAILHEARLTAIIDDLHNADSASLDLLRGLIVATTKSRVSWVVTSRHQQRHEVASAEFLEEMRRLHVGRLDTTEALSLVSSTSVAHRLDLTPEMAKSVVAAAGGNPLFVRELSVSRSSGSAASLIPETLQRVISERLSRLSELQLRLMRLVALFGADATPSRIDATARVDGAVLSSAIEQLERDGLISVSPARTFELHECWQRAIIDGLEGATRTALCFECASVLCSDEAFEQTPGAIWRAADLFQQAGEATRAARLFMMAADRLLASGFPNEAAELLRRSLVDAAPPGLRTPVAARLARALLASGLPDECLAVANGALSAASLNNEEERTAIAMLEGYRVQSLFKLAQPHEADLRRLSRIVSDSRLSPATRQSLSLAGIRSAANSQHLDLERSFFEAATATISSSRPSTAGALVALIYHTENGGWKDLLECQNRLISEMDNEESAEGQCLLLRSLSHSLRLAGRLDEAVEIGERGFKLAMSRALFADASYTAAMLSFVHLDSECVDEAERWLALAADSLTNSPHSQLSGMLGHARARILLQREEFEEGARLLEAREAAIRTDPILMSRSAELSTYLYLMAVEGRPHSETGLLEMLVSDCERLCGRCSGDYPIEMLARLYRYVGQEHEATRCVEKHLRAREEKIARPVLPFQKELRRVASTLHSR